MDNLQLPIVNEIKVTGRAERILIDKAAKLWQRISRWTHACDVEFNDGERLDTKFSNITNTINNIMESFQDGVNKIYNKLLGLGFTPNPNSPDGICNAIQNVYDERYEDGRTQGRTDVINNPSNYGISNAYKVELWQVPTDMEDGGYQRLQLIIYDKSNKMLKQGMSLLTNEYDHNSLLTTIYL